MAVITDGTGATQVGVDNERAKVALFDASGAETLAADGTTAAGKLYLPIAGRNDGTLRPINVDRRGSVQLAPIVLGLSELCEGATLDTQSKWNGTNTTMAAAQTASGGIQINTGAITTLNTNYALVSQRRFERRMRNPLMFRARARLVGATNTTIELGFGDSTGATACQNGAYWQVTPGGVVQPAFTYNGIDITGTNIAGSISNANFYQWGVIVDDDSVIYICQNTATGAIVSEQTIPLPLTQAKMWAATHIPVVARCFIGGTAAGSAPAVFITEAVAGYMDGSGAINKPWSHVAGEMKPSVWSPIAPATAAVSWANSAEPASATLSNTAAGYTTLGGKFQFAAPGGAVTDFALFGYTVPSPYTFVCTGIHISTWNVGAAVATTPHLLQWFAAPNQGAVSLATGTGRFALGAQSFPVGAAIGALANEIVRSFHTPLVTQPGRFFDIGLRIPVGTATASQIIAGFVSVEGYFE